MNCSDGYCMLVLMSVLAGLMILAGCNGTNQSMHSNRNDASAEALTSGSTAAHPVAELDNRPHAVVIIGEDHFYGAIDSMWDLAKALQTHYGMRTTVLQATSRTTIPGLEALDDADIAIFFIRRRVLSKESLGHVRDYLAAGKPLVAFRTTSHAFAPLQEAFAVSADTTAHTADSAAQQAQAAADRDPWPTFDRDVLGGYYQGYYLGETLPRIVPDQRNHPILQGIDTPTQIRETLNINLPLADTAQVLMMGKAVDGAGDDPRYRLETEKEHIDQPVAWTNEYHGGRIFYTSMGNGRAAFQQPWFRQMVINAVFWGLEQPVPDVPQDAYVAPTTGH